MHATQLAHVLLRSGRIDIATLARIEDSARAGVSAAQALIDAGVISDSELSEIVALHFGSPAAGGAVARVHAAPEALLGSQSEPVSASMSSGIGVGTELDAPAVRLLNEILVDAAMRGASDLHFEPAERDWRVRFRIDGALCEAARPPPHLRDALISRIKVLARLDIAERRTPQDGRLRLAVAPGRFEDFRVSTLPTMFSEKVVLRRLDAAPSDLSLASLGLHAGQQAALAAAIRAPHGMTLVTGPTGSGKTVSLCCCLQMLDRQALNVCTVEDPVEIQLPGVTQVGIREKAGLTFAAALRALLRQDPDVIMIGEIRDHETADVAVKAAQTGHLVLSTLHTNDAPATLARLLDIGVAPFNVASAVRLITAQRLVRKLCVACRRPLEVGTSALRAAGVDEQSIDSRWRAYRPVGCPDCHGIGYRGRIGIHQVMPVSAAMREIIVARGGVHALARQARAEQIATLRDAALVKVGDGITSLDEALCATEANE